MQMFAIKYNFSSASCRLKSGLSILLVIAAFNISHAQTAKTKVACIGNSVTYGYGHTDPGNTSYPSVLQRLLGTDYEVKNFGHSGATLLKKGHNPYFKTRAFKEAVEFNADIAIIHLGLNDTDPRNWPAYKDEFEPDYSWLIDTLRKSNPGIKIYISKLSPIFPDHKRFLSGTRDWFWQIQELIPKIAIANNVGLLDFHEALYSRPDLFPDPLHPNEDGADLLAHTVYKKISGNFGGLKLPFVFASNMVFQRNNAVPFYGIANAGDTVKVLFNSQSKFAIANDDGNWKVLFPSLKAGGPYTAFITSSPYKINREEENLTVKIDYSIRHIIPKRMSSPKGKSSSQVIELKNIFIGEVWICSGQSNMDFPLCDAVNSKDEMLKAQNNSHLFLLNREPIAGTDNTSWDSSLLSSVNRLEYFSGSWKICDSNSAKDFSAVAYYYGKQIQHQLNVPVGLIQVAVGGSTTESWIDRKSMEHHPVLVNELTNWRKSDFFMDWVRQRADTNLKHSSNSKQRHPFDPSYNFEAGINDLIGFPVKGVLWYQGESNAHNTELHETLFSELVRSWRSHWGYELPFYFVQLSSLNRPTWAHFRASQFELQKRIPSTYMAVTSDLGEKENVHPRHKKEVGDRLARLALHHTYGFSNIISAGPSLVDLKLKGKKAELTFDQELHIAGSDTLKGFELVDDKGKVRDGLAKIFKTKVLIPLDKNEKIMLLRYAWKPFTNANMVNKEGLPASTFQIKINPK